MEDIYIYLNCFICRIMIFKMNLNFDLLLEKVAMEDRHFQKHFRMNLEDLMEEMVAMVLTLSFKVKVHNTN